MSIRAIKKSLSRLTFYRRGGGSCVRANGFEGRIIRFTQSGWRHMYVDGKIERHPVRALLPAAVLELSDGQEVYVILQDIEEYYQCEADKEQI